MQKILKILFILTMTLGLMTSVQARWSEDAGPVRFKGESARTDATGIRALLVHDIGNVRMTLSNWGEQGNPDQTAGYFGFEFPLGSETDFLYSSGIWVGAIVGGEKLVSTGTDGDNGTNEFAPSLDPTTAPSGYVATSKQYSEIAGRPYIMGAKEIDDDGDWWKHFAETPELVDLDGNGEPSTNWDKWDNSDGGGGIIGRNDDGDTTATGDPIIDEEIANGIDDDEDGLIDEDTDESGDANDDGNCNYDPEPYIDEDPAGDISNDFIDNDFDGLADGDDPDFDGDAVPCSLDDDGDGLEDEDGVARGTQELFCVYDDRDPDEVQSPDPELHTPLNIMVLQRTYAWGEDYAASFILVDLIVRNVGTLPLTEVYMGLFADPDVANKGEAGDPASVDDWNIYDEENLMMIQGDDTTDADGFAPGLFAMKVVRTPGSLDELNIAFKNFERVAGGDPETNAEKYDLISDEPANNSPPTPELGDWRFLMGFGPKTGGWMLQPGGELPVTVAFIAGEDIPDIQKNARWAQAIYDNDFQGPAAPDQPEFWVEAYPNHARIYWRDNSETSVDPITQELDFEGYEIQRSTNMNTWFSLAQFDIDNELQYEEFERENLNLGMPYDEDIFERQPDLDGLIGWEWEIADGDTVGRLYWFDDYDVLRRQTYYYIVRAFDQGVPGAGVLITPIGRSYVPVTIGYTEDTQPPDISLDNIYVYPNPYKGGHEKEFDGALNEDGDKIYPRKLWFANLPATGVRIDIYTLSGDHIVKIDHPAGTESYMWNMRNKYDQEIVSGVYYYVVEADGKQIIDKFVVLK